MYSIFKKIINDKHLKNDKMFRKFLMCNLCRPFRYAAQSSFVLQTAPAISRNKSRDSTQPITVLIAKTNDDRTACAMGRQCSD